MSGTAEEVVFLNHLDDSVVILPCGVAERDDGSANFFFDNLFGTYDFFFSSGSFNISEVSMRIRVRSDVVTCFFECADLVSGHVSWFS